MSPGSGSLSAPAADAVDDDFTDTELVRAFMLTRGRTRASSPELPVETLVSSPSSLLPSDVPLAREHRRIRTLVSVPMSIAEVSVHLAIPLQAAVVVVSEMVAAGSLIAGDTVDSTDTKMLLKIRSALQLL